MDGSTSTLTTSAASAQVGGPGSMTSSPLSATTTLRDYYNNPVNGKQVSIFAPGTHASVLPATAPTTSAYPETANDGTVNYNVSDSCAETVDLKSVDVDDNEPIANPSQVAVTFTPAPPTTRTRLRPRPLAGPHRSHPR